MAFRAVALGILLHVAAAAPPVREAAKAGSGRPSEFLRTCTINERYSEADLRKIQKLNCGRVTGAFKDVRKAENTTAFRIMLSTAKRAQQLESWMFKVTSAHATCQLSQQMLNRKMVTEATKLAVMAWGSQMMNGKECCALPYPPYCEKIGWSFSGVVMVCLLAIPILLFLGTVVFSCIEERKEPDVVRVRETSRGVPTLGPADGGARAADRMSAKLRDIWMERSSLRVLPGGAVFGSVSAGLFGFLHERFDFQADSVANQFEHLLSLWRSHVSMVADRYIEENAEVQEEELLAEGLRDLHGELLEGFLKWRARLRRCADAGVSDEDVPALARGGLQALPDPELSVQLVEVAAYLLVWGEAGNLRFMPELIYFITELVLSAGEPGPRGLYGDAGACEDRPGSPFRSGLFLSNIVRPIYNIVFREWHRKVDVDPKSGKDAKKLHPGFEAFLPKDVNNYDDWNELFGDHDRLVNGLVFQDGGHLFDLPHERRFMNLPKVDWEQSFEPGNTKTHREIHSLWGFFATTHRVWLVHAVLFFLGLCIVAGDPPWPSDGGVPLLGQTKLVRFAAIGLLVPVHGLLWSFSRWHTTGRATRNKIRGSLCLLCHLLRYALLLAPAATYVLVRREELSPTPQWSEGTRLIDQFLVLHFTASAAGLIYLLFFPSLPHDRLHKLTPVPLRLRLVRYFFWFCLLAIKFLLSLVSLQEMFEATLQLQVTMPGRESFGEIGSCFFNVTWVSGALYWLTLWGCTFIVFISDTQLWFTVGCAFLGTATVMVQRRCFVFDCAFGDAIAKIPSRFSEKILPYVYLDEQVAGDQVAPFSGKFPRIWDRIIEYMRYEDKCGNQMKAEASFRQYETGGVRWPKLSEPLSVARPGKSPKSPESTGGLAISVKVPKVLEEKNLCTRFINNYCGVRDQAWPDNADMQWRLTALARGLALPMPRPFRAPYIPGITVLIPHYMETIIMEKKELFRGDEQTVPLMDWLEQRYDDEYRFFVNRQKETRGADAFAAAGRQWSEYTDAQWEKICLWASMRMQTLYRTVAGMCLYHPALQTLWELQGDKRCQLGSPQMWDPSEVFTCMVSMQMYKFFPENMLAHTNKMFKKFPKCLKVAFIDYEDKGANAELDNIGPDMARRYFSCLIDGSCSDKPGGKRGEKQPLYRIELPGYPILGDGKGDNQNHAIPFTRGTFQQCIDANQGAYFEQMLFLPSVLGEFRTRERGDGGSKRIIGLPEHITSDIGSIGDFAASAERAFGTLLQRTYSLLGGRMHYGHPDIMNKEYMMQQGGVSKATKTLNLSEDIFAGMDFTLRGEGRRIHHCEYFHLAKGRDLGFNTVLGFFSKISSGAGEQIITRQMFRLSQLLHLPEMLTFWYAHVGYYTTQLFVSIGMPMLVALWLFVLTTGCEETFSSFACPAESNGAEVMGRLFSTWYSALMWFFLLGTSLPLMMQIWYEEGPKSAVTRIAKTLVTCSPILFIFQAKVIAYYFINELRYGGATYVSTGRGLPTERRPFVGLPLESGLRMDPGKVGGLYLDYSQIAYYEGWDLLFFAILVLVVGGVEDAGVHSGNLGYFWFVLVLTIVSWLLGPFIFNPYQFVAKHFREDLRAWGAFFLQDNGNLWVEWYNQTQLKADKAQRRFANYILDVQIFAGFFFFAAWYSALNVKMHVLANLWSGSLYVTLLEVLVFLPPILASSTYCLLASLAECLVHGRSGANSRDVENMTGSSDEEDDGCCSNGFPLVVSAVWVIVLDCVESVSVILPVLMMGWTRTFVAGLVLKYFLVSHFTVFLGEGALRSRWFKKLGRAGQPVVLFVRAHRMARDLVVSATILIALSPLVLLNALNEMCCPGCSVHQLLIYRDPGHQQRQETVVFDIDGDGSELATPHGQRFEQAPLLGELAPYPPGGATFLPPPPGPRAGGFAPLRW